MIDPAPPPQRPPITSSKDHDYSEALKKLRAPLDAMAPTPTMFGLLAFLLVLFVALICFVAHNDRQRNPPEPPNGFDWARQDRQITWCATHGGVPAMTFTSNGSNALCLRLEAVIPLPQ